MPKVNPKNERIKREYLIFLKETEGIDESTIDKVAAALREFELAIGVKPFKAFHRDWASKFKRHLEKRKNARTGKPLALTTRDATLRIVKAFVKWLPSQPGYKSRVTYADAQYFNPNRKESRIAHTSREKPYPSLQQCAHAFRLMPETTELERRDKAMFAFLILTGCRDGAMASLRLKHIDLIEGHVYQDAREVRTKAAKTIDTWFFPVDQMYLECFQNWVNYLRIEKLFSPSDALFPKCGVGVTDGRFGSTGLTHDPYSNAQRIVAVVREAFRNAGLFEFGPHSFRTTLAMLGNEVCKTLEASKAWSQNLGHESLATTISAYMPVSRERQKTLIRGD